MKIPIHENIIFTHQKVAEEAFKMYSFLIYPFLKILVVGTHKSIAEVPGILLTTSTFKVNILLFLLLVVVRVVDSLHKGFTVIDLVS